MSIRHLDTPKDGVYLFDHTTNSTTTVMRVLSDSESAVVWVWTSVGWKMMVEYPLPPKIKQDKARFRMMSPADKEEASKRDLAVAWTMAQRAARTMWEHIPTVAA